MNYNMRALHEAKKLPWAKRIRCSVSVTPQILIISSEKTADRQQAGTKEEGRVGG